MNIRVFCLFFCFALILIGCKNKEKYAPPYFETSNASSEQQESLPGGELSSGDIIAVPFIESGGVKYIEVELNRTFSVRMILHLYSKGVLTDDDFVGTSRSMIADGTIVENMVVNLREVIIGGKIICPNVPATISSNAQAPLLLGNEVLNRTASYTVDNQNKTINFKLN